MAFEKFVLIVVLAGLYGVDARQNDVFSIIDSKPWLSMFKSWCEPLRSFYQGLQSVTVFAFNDSSYNSVPDQRARLQQIKNDENARREYCMTYTVLSKLTVSDLASVRSTKSSNGNTVFVARREFRQWGTATSTGVTFSYINGARVIGEPLIADNGFVYVLDRPPDLPSTLNVYQWIMNDGDGTGIPTTNMKRLMERLYANYYQSAIQPITGEKVTFFLPSEKALQEIPAGELSRVSDSNLANYFKMHYISGEVLYTSFVNHQESARSGISSNQVLFLRNGPNVNVKSGRVTASIVRGNITVSNGVIHIIDTMFGLVYRNLQQQIQADCPRFGGLIQRISDPQLSSKLSAGVTIFAPNDEAFNRIRNINFDQNRTLLNYVVGLSMIKDGTIEVARLNGNYDVRQHRYSWYDDWKLVIYNDRNETWVNGGHVRARILKPDIETDSGKVQVIDAVLGIPSMDLPNLIYYDDYLLWTYWDIESVGLVDYIKDPRFDKSALPIRTFDRFGGNMYGGYGGNMYTTQYPGQQTQYPQQTPYPGFQTTQYPNQGGGQWPNQGGNQYPNQGNQYPNQGNQYPNQGNQYPNNQYPNNQYPNQGGSNQYPNNQYPNQGGNNNNPYGPQNQVASYGRCRDLGNVCQFTYFVPNGSAIWNYKNTQYGRQISMNPNLYRYILRRTLVLDRVVYLENMAPGQRDLSLYTHTGETIFLRKEQENLARLTWSPGDRPGQRVTAKVIMWDLGATNGVVHVIDNVLSQNSDLTIDPNGAKTYTASLFTIVLLFVIAKLCQR